MPAYYKSTIRDFIDDDPNRICGVLAKEIAKTGFRDHKNRQTKAWEIEIDCLQEAARALLNNNTAYRDWGLLLEYPIPRRQKRIDLVLLARDVILCIEFKTDAKTHALKTRKQVEDYALDLRDFHEESRDRRIVPIAVSTAAADNANRLLSGFYPDLVRPTLVTNKTSLENTIHIAYLTQTDPGADVIDIDEWDASAYHPVPTIIEAAEALYAGHDVRAIAQSHAGDENLNKTAHRVLALVRRAERRKEKIACFITGIPGAGKTLAGLNIAHNPSIRSGGRAPGVFLSGNGPLVKVIREAIHRDFKQRVGEGDAERTTGTFIQNVHTFIKFNLQRKQASHENLIVFDEAQRAWDAAQVARKHDDSGEVRSEPEMMLSIMDRHEWAVVVALVGGGQEIYQGEAGLQGWGLTLLEKFPKWRVAASPQAIRGDASIAGHQLFEGRRPKQLVRDPSLHLSVNRRAYRAQQVTEWVEAVLRLDATAASKIARKLRDFPLKITRSLKDARKWLRQQTRGLRRAGLVASSGGIRLRAEGLELSYNFRSSGDLYVNWFLNEPPDVRSSNQLEVAASEFECQGLELDWVGVCWSGDLTLDGETDTWNYRNFKGNKWKEISDITLQQQLINKYRVLLTRAREGMVIWIPHGNSADETRPIEWFQTTAKFLKSCGPS